MKETNLKYEELLKKVKKLELENNQLKEIDKSITNFEFFINESLDLIWVVSTDGVFKEINSSFQKVLGYSKKEINSNNPFTDFIHPEDKAKTYLDLILMDIQMPKKNGYETTAEIRAFKNNTAIPIIALTAGIMLDDKEKCIKAGMNDYIPKPIIECELEEKIFQSIE